MHTPKLAHSQNSLHSPALVRRLIRIANIRHDDVVVEIGAGRGIITRQLAKICSKVIAIEYDAALYDKLKHDLRAMDNVELHCGDFLTYDLPAHEFKIFANIPFNVTAAIIARMTTGDRLPTDAYLVVQEEAARKYAGLPYARESLKSLLIKPQFKLSIVHHLANTDFVPAPSVHIVFLHMHKRHIPLLKDAEYKQYRGFLCFVFSRHGKDIEERTRAIFTRPQLGHLAREWQFSTAARPVDLSVDQWLGIISHYLTGVSAEKQRLVQGAEKRLLKQQSRLAKIHRNRRNQP
jgi:23S rRNA (adenine-N6)-dimethyltransferase